MESGTADIMFEYAHIEGSWTVVVEESRYPGMCLVSVSDGSRSDDIPLLLSPQQVEMTIEKLSKIPAGSVSSFDVFSGCVAGAASLSIKYGR